MTRPTLASWIVAACGFGIVADAGMAADGVAPRRARATPIVAEVLGQPDHFIGRPVAIYGLVVEALDGGRRFMLQDVSQAPLLVVAPPGEKVAQGSQLMVHGIVRSVNGRLQLAGTGLQAVQVVAGGGCC